VSIPYYHSIRFPSLNQRLPIWTFSLYYYMRMNLEWRQISFAAKNRNLVETVIIRYHAPFSFTLMMLQLRRKQKCEWKLSPYCFLSDYCLTWASIWMYRSLIHVVFTATLKLCISNYLSVDWNHEARLHNSHTYVIL